MAPRGATRVDLRELGPPEKLPEWAKKLADAHNTNADLANEAAAAGTKVAESVVARFRDIVVRMPSSPPYISATLLNGANIGAGFYDAGYLMLPGGHVFLRGSVVALLNGESIFQLPAGYWPSGDQAFLCDSVDAGSISALRISTAGLVTMLWTTGTTGLDGYAFLECCRFHVASAAAPHKFTTAGWPMVVEHGLARATGVHVTRCRAKGVVGAEAAGSPYVDWEDRGDGTLKIHAVWGLQWGKTYDVRVVISSEP